MIVLSEHYGYEKSSNRYLLKEEEVQLCRSNALEKPIYKHFKNIKDNYCFTFNKSENNIYQFETSYFIGVDWIIENKLPIYIQPKLNTEEKEIDYIAMFFEALKEPENLNHLEHLYTIDFNAPLIEIKQQQDLLTPLILVEFLNVLKRIVRKGLKKSYYKVTENLNAKVKGKILINKTVKQNHSKQKMLYNICNYQEFGYNSIENRILKKALQFTQSALNSLNSNINFNSLIMYCSPAFEKVNADIDIRELKIIKPNPLFKEYSQALKLAKLILKKYGYNISRTNSAIVKTPPFWIDMTQLFELFVFKKLREVFPKRNEVMYHYKTNYQELDYLINSKEKNIKIVVDAKYKNRYKYGNISKEDARQVSGYSRLKSVYKQLNMEDSNQLIDCLIIYPNQDLDDNINFVTNFENNKEVDDNYVQLYKLSVKLPYVKN